MLITRLFAFFVLTIASLLLSCLSAESLPQPMELHLAAPPQRTITLPTGTQIRAEVADTESSRQRGLMFRDRLPSDEGMLFIFEQPMPYRFWMKNCKFPIDIIWMNEQKVIVYITENAPPCKSDPCPTYGPTDVASRYVLEVTGGEAKRKKLALSQVLRF
jgi:uncharacterized membrane protein (UPF0127 family)